MFAWIGLEAEDGDILSFTKWNELIDYIDTKVDFLYVDQQVSLKQDKIYTAINVDTSTVDLTNYQLGDLIKSKENLDYTVELDSSSQKILTPVIGWADLTEYYTKAEMDASLDLKADITYVDTETTSIWDNFVNYLTSTEITSLFYNKIEVDDIAEEVSVKPYLDDGENNLIDLQFYGANDTRTVNLTGELFQPNMKLDLSESDYSQEVTINDPNSATIVITSLADRADRISTTFANHFPSTVSMFAEIFSMGNIEFDVTDIGYFRNGNLGDASGFKAYTVGDKNYILSMSTNHDRIMVTDVTDPANSVLKDVETSVDYLDMVRYLDVFEDASGNVYGLFMDNDSFNEKLTIYDITNPSSLRYKTSYQDDQLDDIRKISSVTVGDVTYIVAAESSNDSYDYFFIYKYQNGSLTYNQKIGVSYGRLQGVSMYEHDGKPYFVGTASYSNRNYIDVYELGDETYTRKSQFVDTTNCRQPMGVGTYKTESNTYAIVYSSSKRQFCLLDITDPTNPVLQSTFGYTSISQHVRPYISKGRVFVPVYSSSDNWEIYDATFPTNVIEKTQGSVTSTYANTGLEIVETNDELYLIVFGDSTYNRFQIFDLGVTYE